MIFLWFTRQPQIPSYYHRINTTGKDMSKHHIKWCKFQLDMLHSPAFQDLGKPATTILLYTLMQLQWHNTAKKTKRSNWVCSNANEIKLQYATFNSEPYSMKNMTITRGIDSLLANGFIEIVEQGGSAKNHASVYAISDKWRTWKKGDNPISVRAPYRKRGWTNKK